jgi:transposase-like protein
MSILSQIQFQNEAEAYKWVEARIWPNGPVCPHCGGFERISPMKGKSTRIGTYKCYQCRQPFTVKIGTIFESSHIKMHIWLQAMYLMCSGKKGISANQLHRTLGVSLKSAWFMAHRIREAMRSGGFSPLGGGGKIVEADETFLGRREGAPKGRGAYHHKMKVLSLVERGGSVRSMVLNTLTKRELRAVLRANIARETRLMTDRASYYKKREFGFDSHETVNHIKGEYVRGDVHTNTLEGYFSLSKRGMKGVYQHCREKHLHRYLAEFDFRYNARASLGVNDEARAERALRGIVGKRLTYLGSQRAM